MDADPRVYQLAAGIVPAEVSHPKGLLPLAASSTADVGLATRLDCCLTQNLETKFYVKCLDDILAIVPDTQLLKCRDFY